MKIGKFLDNELKKLLGIAVILAWVSVGLIGYKFTIISGVFEILRLIILIVCSLGITLFFLMLNRENFK